jgi:hypothetical protein
LHVILKFPNFQTFTIKLFHSSSAQKYPIIGVKSKDFADFCLIAELMKNKKHLTTEGLNQIRQIKAGMNKGR